MNYLITDFIKSIFFSFRASILITFSAYAIICFAVSMTLKLRFKKIVDKGYAIFCFSGLLLKISIVCALEIKLFYALFLCFFYAFLCLIFYGIICLFNPLNEDKLLTELIDKEIDKPVSLDKIEEPPVIVKDYAQTETDFSHVKNVIERLNYYPLSQADNRQVRELKEAVFFAEKEGITDPLREKINDGLSALLKIMSKHGV